MLQTCSRCRSRRIKCDSLLPACANCAKSDLQCTFRDDALQENIPRSYIKTLNERVEHLTSQLTLLRPENSTQESSDGQVASTSYAFNQPSNILVPAKSGADLHLDNSVPSRFTRVVFEALQLADAPSGFEKDFPDDDHVLVPNVSYADRSQLTPSIVRFLLGRYDRCIKAQYDVTVPGLSNHDGQSLKKLPNSLKFKILMACAIAAAREAYKAPNWKPLAQICRDWANEMITPIISAGNSDTLTAIILLLVYELADPIRGIAWELLDLAARTCLQLGWHQAPLVSNLGEVHGADGHGSGTESTYSPEEARLMAVLKDIEGSLQTIFNRPTMLSGSKLPTTPDNEAMYDLYIQISDHLYGRGRLYETQGCPFVGEISTLMDLLDSLQTKHPIAKVTWLSFLPVCFKHKQCIFCFQEADEQDTKGMRTLRKKVISAASELISSVHRTATAQDDFIPPIIASSQALVSGCTITTAILKRWTSAQTHVKDLVKCSEILTMFAPHWNGGNNYLGVWRTIIDHIELKKCN